MVDSIGYTGTVLVLLFKECFNPDLNWLEFYNTMAGTVGIVCCVAFSISLVYLIQRYKKGRHEATAIALPAGEEAWLKNGAVRKEEALSY